MTIARRLARLEAATPVANGELGPRFTVQDVLADGPAIRLACDLEAALSKPNPDPTAQAALARALEDRLALVRVQAGEGVTP